MNNNISISDNPRNLEDLFNNEFMQQFSTLQIVVHDLRRNHENTNASIDFLEAYLELMQAMSTDIYFAAQAGGIDVPEEENDIKMKNKEDCTKLLEHLDTIKNKINEEKYKYKKESSDLFKKINSIENRNENTVEDIITNEKVNPADNIFVFLKSEKGNYKYILLSTLEKDLKSKREAGYPPLSMFTNLTLKSENIKTALSKEVKAYYEKLLYEKNLQEKESEINASNKEINKNVENNKALVIEDSNEKRASNGIKSRIAKALDEFIRYLFLKINRVDQ